MDEQEIPQDVPVLPELTNKDRRIIKAEVAKQEKEIRKKCIVCQQPAEYSMRGIPTNVYCKQCAIDYFKFLNYLEQLK